MPRADLLALTDDGLIQLANAGLVKRGLKELAAGQAPELAEEPDGTVSARFADGTLTRLSPGRALTDATCTCPSSGTCRHRVMLALAYRARFAAEEPEPEAWDPGTVDGDAFEATLDAGQKRELAKLAASWIEVHLERGRVPGARLPMASVRFLAPHDLAYARCDCAVGQRCAHVALALRAFKASDGHATVVLGSAQPAAPLGLEALGAAVDRLLSGLLDSGVVSGMAAHAGALEAARGRAEAAGAVQIVLALDAVAEQVSAYETRSAIYDERTVLDHAVSLLARLRVGDETALGLGQPFETAMGKTRLVSLGARLRTEGRAIRAAVALADTDTGATLVLERLFTPASETDRLGDTIRTRQIVPGLMLAATARGQILTSVGRRRADGLLALGSGTGGRTTLGPRDAAMDFVSPLKVSDAGDLATRFTTRAPAFLRPKLRADDFHVFAVRAVLGQAWEPGSQLWQGAVELEDGSVLHCERAYDGAAPGALDSLSAAFEEKHGALRQIAGPVRLSGGALVCTPWSLGTDSFVVPDVADQGEGSTAPALGGWHQADSLAEQAARALAGALHAGLRLRTEQWRSTQMALAKALSEQGYRQTAERFEDWLNKGGGLDGFGRCGAWIAALLEEAG